MLWLVIWASPLMQGSSRTTAVASRCLRQYPVLETGDGVGEVLAKPSCLRIRFRVEFGGELGTHEWSV